MSPVLGCKRAIECEAGPPKKKTKSADEKLVDLVKEWVKNQVSFKYIEEIGKAYPSKSMDSIVKAYKIVSLRLIDVASWNDYEQVCEFSSLADLDYRDEEDWSALGVAVWEGHEQVVFYLLNRGASVDQKNKNNMTLLHLAVQKRNFIILRHLLRYPKAPLNQLAYGKWTPLKQAAALGDLTSVKMLLQAGADPDNDSKNCTALSLAKKGGHQQVVSYLTGPKINEFI